MFRRILRSTIVLAAVIGAYQAYVLFAVPHMEPSLATKEKHQADKVELNNAKNAVSKYQRLLSNYFPIGHWTQVRTPKIFANGTETTMLVIDDYTRHPVDGDDKSTQVDIKRLAMLMFPTSPHGDVAAPRNAIVLEAQQGAKLLFDDFHPEMGRVGQITRGEFPGPIVIRSDMREPGPDDDLLVETSDLHMNTKLLYTASPVKFRMGQNVGSGRELEIRFLADEHAQPKDNGMKIAGFDSLEIRRDVRMRMQLDTASLLPGGEKKEPKPNPSVQVNDPAKSAPAAPKPPVDITCNGPFTFDFVRYVASVDRDVEVRQLNPDGPCDQLNCNQLDIHFAPKAPAPDAKPEPVVVDPSKKQQRDLGRLEAAAIIAFGHPAIAISPAKKVEARGDRIQIALREQRVRIEGGNDTRLTSGPNVIQAPIIDYQAPEKESTSQVGRFRATGPGSLHFVADPTKPDQIFQAAWQTSVQLGRDQGQPVIVMEGRPELAFAAAGSIMGDQIRLYLRELDGNAAVGVAVGSGDKQSKLVPDRMIALGHVKISSPQMIGHTQQLVANFQVQPDTAVDPTSPTNQSTPSKAAPAGPAGPAGKSNAAPKDDQPQQTYQVVADKMRLEVFLRGQTAVPATLACDGNIIVHEVSPAAANQQPTEIRGAQLFVDKLDSKTPHITLKGASIGGGGNQPAQLAGRGVTLLTAMVEMDGHDNHMWSDGPGEATVLMTRDLQGNASATPTPVKIDWQNGLRFDGQTITFDRDVVVSTADSKLHCDRMLARLVKPLQFGQHMDQTATSFSQIDCEGQVNIENLSRDTGGVTSHDRMQLGHLTINQETGAIRGEGPGVIRSTRFGSGLEPVAGAQNAKPQAASPAASAPGSKLHFLRVDFHSGMDGNMYTRMLTFHDRVRSVYGPVDAWEQELELTRPESLPPESMTLSCDELQLNEDPLAARAAAANPNNAGAKPMAVQMRANGNVQIQGESLAQGQFRVQADNASYDKAKEMFILEGDTRTPAKLWRKTGAGVSPPYEARKIYYNRQTNEVKGVGIQYLEISPGDVQKATRQPATGLPMR
jgi:lipopolysaccharide export system protein LptA